MYQNTGTKNIKEIWKRNYPNNLENDTCTRVQSQAETTGVSYEYAYTAVMRTLQLYSLCGSAVFVFRPEKVLRVSGLLAGALLRICGCADHMRY